MMRSRLLYLSCFALAAALLGAPLTAFAAGSGSPAGAEFGPRIGISSTPDQIVLGGQVQFPEFAPHLTVDPNVEIGFLDHQTVVALNADFFYHFALQGSVWAPYAGMGLGIAIYQFDDPRLTSDTVTGANLVLGAGVPTRSGNRFFGELRAGLGNIPTLKLMVGWNFRM